MKNFLIYIFVLVSQFTSIDCVEPNILDKFPTLISNNKPLFIKIDDPFVIHGRGSLCIDRDNVIKFY